MEKKVLDFCQKSLIRGHFGFVVVLGTTPAMNKKDRLTKQPNPYLGRVEKRTTYSNVLLGSDYSTIVESRARMTADNPKDVGAYDAEKSRFGAWIDPEKGKFLRQKNGQTYLQFLYRRNTTNKPIWFIDGREATQQEIADIKRFLTASNPTCKKQIEFGVDADNVVHVRCPKLESVRLISWGEHKLVLK